MNASKHMTCTPRRARSRALRSAIGALSALSVFAVAACGGSSDGGGEGDPYEVAVVADLSGAFGPFGTQTVAGIEAAFSEINAAGGVNGRPIDVTSTNDSQSTPPGAQVAVRRAYDKRPVAILSGWTSGSIAATAPVLESHGDTPFIAYTAPDDLLYPPKDWYYSVGSTIDQQVSYMVAGIEQLLGALDGKKIAVEAINTPGAIGQLDGITEKLEGAGAEIVAGERTATGAVASFGSQAAKITNAEPDLVMMLDTPANVITVAKALKANGYDGPMFANEGGAEQAVFDAVNAPNFYMAWPFDVPTEGSTIYEAADKNGDASKLDGAIRGAFGWVMAYALADALENCEEDSCSGQALMDSLQSQPDLDLGGDDVAFGPVGFSDEAHYAVSTWQILSWDAEKGERVPFGDPLTVE